MDKQDNTTQINETMLNELMLQLGFHWVDPDLWVLDGGVKHLDAVRAFRRYVEESMRQSLEWRIEQMRRVRTFMAKSDYDEVMAELAALQVERVSSEEPTTAEHNTPQGEN